MYVLYLCKIKLVVDRVELVLLIMISDTEGAMYLQQSCKKLNI